MLKKFLNKFISEEIRKAIVIFKKIAESEYRIIVSITKEILIETVTGEILRNFRGAAREIPNGIIEEVFIEVSEEVFKDIAKEKEVL